MAITNLDFSQNKTKATINIPMLVSVVHTSSGEQPVSNQTMPLGEIYCRTKHSWKSNRTIKTDLEVKKPFIYD